MSDATFDVSAAEVMGHCRQGKVVVGPNGQQYVVAADGSVEIKRGRPFGTFKVRKPNGNPLVPISKPVKRPNKTTDHSTRAAAPVQRFDPTPTSEHPRGPSAPPHPRTAASCSTDAAISVPPSRPSGTTDTSRPAAAVRPTKTTKALKLLRADLKAGQVVQYNNTQMTVGPDGVTLVKKRGRPFEDAKKALSRGCIMLTREHVEDCFVSTAPNAVSGGGGGIRGGAGVARSAAAAPCEGPTPVPAVQRSQGGPRVYGARKKRVPASSATPDANAAAGNTGKAAKRTYFNNVEVNDEVYEVGDTVYLMGSNCPKELEEQDELCKVCGKDPQAGTMLECDACLCGFHLHCLDPPLSSVPDSDWLCTTCAEKLDSTGVVPTAEHTDDARRTARELFLSGKDELLLGRIERVFREGTKGHYQVTVRWYMLPEETHTGRCQHHSRREVFLSSLTNDNDADTIYRGARVATPAEFAAMWDAGDDVYLCEYMYDASWQRFRRCEQQPDAVVAHAGAGGMQMEELVWDADEQAGARHADEDEDDEEFQLEADDDYGGGKKGGGKQSGKRRQSIKQAGKAQQGAMNRYVMPGAASEKEKSNKRQKVIAPPVESLEAAFEVFGKRKNILSMGLAQVPERTRRHRQKDGPLAQARAALTLASTPRHMPCREEERGKVSKFLRDSVASGDDCLGRCLYIYGVPGTGKTATVLEVVRQLYDEVGTGALPSFQFVEVNGLRLPSPAHAYTALWEALTGSHASPARAAELLESYFASSQRTRQVTVLMVDELDLLVTRNQSVLYNLFDWPTRKNSRLVVVGIANTMDLPERLLPRINSRLGLHRVNFQPYAQEQLQQIIKARLSGLAAFKDKAVELASRKVAAVSGDVRRALELCRRAAEIAEAEQAPTTATTTTTDGDGGDEATHPPEQHLVQMEHITAAVKELFGEPHMVALRTAGPHAKVALCALLCEMRRTGLADVAMEDVYVRYAELCRMHGVVAAAWGAAATAVGRLGEARVLLCEPGALGAAQRVALNVSTDSVEYTLKTQSPELPWLATFMQRLITAS